VWQKGDSAGQRNIVDCSCRLPFGAFLKRQLRENQKGRGVMRKLLVSGAFCFSLVFDGCTTLPSMEEATGGIPVRDIVLRIKCELSDAFMTRDPKWWWLTDTANFAWMKDWTAQADLTLQVVDTAALSPGATYKEPLPNGWAIASGANALHGTTIPAISQSFSVAAGANFGTQASRIETMSLVFSVDELKTWRERGGTEQMCADSDKMDLAGRLGLKEWVAEALTPVMASRTDPSQGELLYAGHHSPPLPASGAKPQQAIAFTPQPAPAKPAAAAPMEEEAKACDAEEAKKIKSEAIGLIDSVDSLNSKTKEAAAHTKNTKEQLKGLYKSVLKSAQGPIDYWNQYEAVLDPGIRAKAKQDLNKIQRNIDNNVRDLKGLVGAINQSADFVANDLKAAEKPKDEAGEIIGLTKTDCNSSKQKLKVLQSAMSSWEAILEKYRNNAIDNEKSSDENFNKALGLASAVEASAGSLKPFDPPISSIGQSVQFILNYGASASPTWTFVRFQGPNNPLVSAGGTRTHILNISLGPASVAQGSAKQPGQAVAASQNNLLWTTLLPSR